MSENAKIYNEPHSIAVVEPGFNTIGIDHSIEAMLSSPASYDIFEDNFSELLKSDTPFTLLMGSGFEEAVAAEGLSRAPCAGLASVEQLRFLKEHGMQRIVMARRHGTLVQNARSVGIETIIGGE